MYGVGVPETLVEVGGSDVGNAWVEFAVNGSDAGKRLGGICSKWLGRGKRLGRITKARWAGGFYKKARLRCVSLATVLREQNTLPKDRRLPSTFF